LRSRMWLPQAPTLQQSEPTDILIILLRFGLLLKNYIPS
jgi:hypothetical protein